MSLILSLGGKSFRGVWVFGVLLVLSSENSRAMQIQILETSPAVRQVPTQDTGKGLFTWWPNGSPDSHLPEACNPKRIDEIFRDSSPWPVQGKPLQEYFDACEPFFAIQTTDTPPLVRTALLKYPVETNPNVRKVEVLLGDGKRIKGFLAMQPTQEARPLIIAKCGLFCDPDAGPTLREVLMQLFEGAPFHVLALANMSGETFIKDNRVLGFGGFDEGRQIFRIAEYLKSVHFPYHDHISEIHVLGISLGGQAALYSGLYASQNESRIQSVLASCPVVSLRASMENIYRPSLVGEAIRWVTLGQVREVLEFIPFVSDILQINGSTRQREILSRLASAAVEFYKKETAKNPWDLAPFQSQRIQDLNKFWSVNEFVSFASQVRVPTLVIASEDDPVVKFQSNTRKLADFARQNGESISVIQLKRGQHCGSSAAYGWATQAHLWRNFFLSHSPSLTSTKSQVSKNWIDLRKYMTKSKWNPTQYKLGRFDLNAKQHLRLKENDENLYVHLKKYALNGGPECGRYDFSDADRKECFVSYEVKVPFRDLNWGASPPRDSREANELTRRLNTQGAEFLDERHMAAQGTSRPIAIMGVSNPF